jgi:serine protease Do
MKAKEFALVSISTATLVLAFRMGQDLSKDHTILRGGSSPAAIPVRQNGRPAGLNEPVNLVPAAEMAIRSTVHIMTQMNRASSRDYDPFGDPLYTPSQPAAGSASGVILSQDGYIVTNNHVIEGANEIWVTLSNHKSLIAKLVGADPARDLAVIKIEATDLPFLLYGNSDELRPGQWVLAAGYPLNLQSTVTAGIISALGKDLIFDAGGHSKIKMEAYIQTDAAINRGNSGGPLLDPDGRLVGINAYLSSPTGTYAGYSFSIPVNIVRKVVSELITLGRSPSS